MGRVGAVLRLTRIEHSAMLVLAVIAAELISGGIPKLPILVLSLIVPIFISMASFAINDYFDVESDRANKRTGRPIVSGEISKSSALAISMVCLAIGIGAGIFINLYAFSIALLFGALAVLYSYRLKDVLLLGNIYIAFAMAVPFVFGDFVVSRTLEPAIIAVFFIVFLSGLAREIHGMIRDYRGDAKARKTRNLVQHTGKPRAAQIAFVLYLEAILISVFVFFFVQPFRYNLYYMVPIAIGDIMLMYVAVTCMIGGSQRTYWMGRNISLVAMSVILIGYLVSPIIFAAL
jgi:4-hydroxybenzoate polyprenyltransferase